jgi:hypothetical protein
MGAFTPGIASGRVLKSDRRSRCRWKCVRRMQRRLRRRVGMYSGVERFGAKGSRVYIERIEENFRIEGRGGGWPRRRRRLRKEAINGSVTRV